mmetsp:Transcript_8154/g.18984  ORF Transcript_8154/g.18984 Transcript_8154/m.18984 type:complete len:260 (-) Transcript_8154:948-1727(-)
MTRDTTWLHEQTAAQGRSLPNMNVEWRMELEADGFDDDAKFSSDTDLMLDGLQETQGSRDAPVCDLSPMSFKRGKIRHRVRPRRRRTSESSAHAENCKEMGMSFEDKARKPRSYEEALAASQPGRGWGGGLAKVLQNMSIQWPGRWSPSLLKSPGKTVKGKAERPGKASAVFTRVVSAPERERAVDEGNEVKGLWKRSLSGDQAEQDRGEALTESRRLDKKGANPGAGGKFILLKLRCAQETAATILGKALGLAECEAG